MGVRCAYKFSSDGCVRAVAGAVVDATVFFTTFAFLAEALFSVTGAVAAAEAVAGVWVFFLIAIILYSRAMLLSMFLVQYILFYIIAYFSYDNGCEIYIITKCNYKRHILRKYFSLFLVLTP